MRYDGSTSIYEPLAKMYKCSPKYTDKLRPIVEKAQIELGLSKTAKHTPELRMAIYKHIKEQFKGQESADSPFKLVNFSIKLPDRRTTISLERYYTDALQSKFKLKNNVEIRQWIEAAIADNIDSDQPITRQVKCLIVKSLL